MSTFLSISPNRLAVYNAPDQLFCERKNPIRQVMPKGTRNPKAGMSRKAKNRLKTALNWLVSCSARRTVMIDRQHKVVNFQVSFITLTLPTKQMHSHSEIKSRCLNLFLQNLRKKYGVHNYVWKAELQKNGNIHFHLSIDKPIHYMAIRRHWNMAISKLGYIQEYAKTFIGMSFSEYCYWQGQKGIYDIKKLKKSYKSGVNTNWSNPNTTDVKSVKNVNNWASYMAKYMAKPCADKNKSGIIADSLEELTGRVWYCSVSISKLGALKMVWTFELQKIIQKFAKHQSVFKLEFDWCKLLYFNIKTLSSELRSFLREHLLNHALLSGYPFPSRFPVW